MNKYSATKSEPADWYFSLDLGELCTRHWRSTVVVSVGTVIVDTIRLGVRWRLPVLSGSLRFVRATWWSTWSSYRPTMTVSGCTCESSTFYLPFWPHATSSQPTLFSALITDVSSNLVQRPCWIPESLGRTCRQSWETEWQRLAGRRWRQCTLIVDGARLGGIGELVDCVQPVQLQTPDYRRRRGSATTTPNTTASGWPCSPRYR